ncbi:hypothetical protein BV25DRAFT_313332 [Artomyces pyxidatus]|uniref:Uncharacterized protein n=1 Tax=Artomyces pyxidatus TaxID=48021 RepID=A0ACB8T886_9AGAM|nr:hypothetical protein BV25DRAFT_313332 [Artomyces pyxidatus]
MFFTAFSRVLPCFSALRCVAMVTRVLGCRWAGRSWGMGVFVGAVARDAVVWSLASISALFVAMHLMSLFAAFSSYAGYQAMSRLGASLVRVRVSIWWRFPGALCSLIIDDALGERLVSKQLTPSSS